MLDDTIRVVAGDCTVIVDGPDRREHRGRVTTLVKPDNTVLVHDADGYQPVAWLTRADSVACDRADGFTVSARKGEERLRVAVHDEDGFAQHPVTAAGVPIGDCRACEGTLVRTRGDVECLDCADRYGVPTDATVTDGRCDCGLPQIRVERGLPFHVCLDYACESLDDAVREAFDREWSCPDCEGDLRIVRRGGLFAGCERYPDCEAAFGIPVGLVTGECGCGLPVFETATGKRCLDTRCDRLHEVHGDGDAVVDA